MGRATTSTERPTYEQLEEIIRRQSNLLTRFYWDTEGLRAAAWLAHHAHGSGHPGYSEEEYAATASHLFRLLAVHGREAHDSLTDAHRAVRQSVLSGLPEGEEADHA